MTCLSPGGRLSALAALCLLLAACVTPDYSADAVRVATALRADTVALLQQADEPFADHAEEAARITAEAQAEARAAARTPGNEAQADQWRLMTDPEENLLAGTLAFWKARGTLSPSFRDEVTGDIAQAFDRIICLEEARRTPGACAALAGEGI